MGFRYVSYGWTGDLMSDGLPTPGAHDGMGVVVQRRIGVGNEMVLVRNHERSTSTSIASIVGIERNGANIINPLPDEELQPGDQVLLLGTREQLDAAKLALSAEAVASSEETK